MLDLRLSANAGTTGKPVPPKLPRERVFFPREHPHAKRCLSTPIPLGVLRPTAANLLDMEGTGKLGRNRKSAPSRCAPVSSQTP